MGGRRWRQRGRHKHDEERISWARSRHTRRQHSVDRRKSSTRWCKLKVTSGRTRNGRHERCYQSQHGTLSTWRTVGWDERIEHGCDVGGLSLDSTNNRAMLEASVGEDVNLTQQNTPVHLEPQQIPSIGGSDFDRFCWAGPRGYRAWGFRGRPYSLQRGHSSLGGRGRRVLFLNWLRVWGLIGDGSRWDTLRRSRVIWL